MQKLWTGKKRLSRPGKIVVTFSKAQLFIKVLPPDDSEDEEEPPVQRKRPVARVVNQETDDEEALVLMLGRMKW